jgi:hypothetical protein
MYELTYAERLRGQRFWLPLLGLLFATVVGVQLQASKSAGPAASTATTPAVLASDNLDPSLRAALTTLGANGLPCSSVITTQSHEVSCEFGAVPSRVTLRSYASHRLAVRAMPAIERSAVARRAGDVAFLVAGKRWVATGNWSQAGDYRTAASPGATVAQQLTKQLSGCLELLPRQHGSCEY